MLKDHLGENGKKSKYAHFFRLRFYVCTGSQKTLALDDYFFPFYCKVVPEWESISILYVHICLPLDASTCMMSEWIMWSPCSASCGMGMRSRERYVKQFPEDGSMCKVPTEETEKCIVNEECGE